MNGIVVNRKSRKPGSGFGNALTRVLLLGAFIGITPRRLLWGLTVSIFLFAGIGALRAEATPGGAFTYAIDIKVPAGRKGIQPNLKLIYNSQSGGGRLMARGWSLQGIGAATAGRAPDGGIPNYGGPGNFDTYYLNGRETVHHCTDSNCSNIEFRTRVESWKNIETCKTTYINPLHPGTTQCNWKVTDPDGTFREYGNNPTASYFGWSQKYPYRLSISKVQDVHGNYMEFFYATDRYEHRPTKIEYTKSIHGGVGFHMVEFNYGARPSPDYINNYSSGAGWNSWSRLTSIVISSAGNRQRKYHIHYDNAGPGGKSRLTRVQECGVDDSPANCLPMVTFNYNSGSSTFTGSETPVVGRAFENSLRGDFNGDGYQDIARYENDSKLNIYLGNRVGGFYFGWSTTLPNTRLGNKAGIRTGDFNGDGRTDLFQITGEANGPTSVYLSTGSGFGSAKSGPFFVIDWNKCIPGGTCNDAKKEAAARFRLSELQIGDFDGDGRSDVLMFDDIHHGHLRISYSLFVGTGGGFTQQHIGSNLFSANLTPDAARRRYIDHSRLRFLDINGDGRTDIFRMHGNGNGGTCIYLAAENKNAQPFRTCKAGPYLYVLEDFANVNPDYMRSRVARDTARVMFGDFNGDGRPDIMRLDGGGGFGHAEPAGSKMSIFYGSGRGFLSSVVPYNNHPFLYLHSNTSHHESDLSMLDIGRIKLGDFNGDGRTDILKLEGNNNTNTCFYFWTGWANGFSNNCVAGPPAYVYESNEPPKYSHSLKWLHKTVHIGDFRGDGKADIAVFSENGEDGPFKLHLYSRNAGSEGLLASVDNGIGAVFNISYLSSTYLRYGSGAGFYLWGTPIIPGACVYPCRASTGARPLVYQYDTTANGSVYKKIIYYFDGRSHASSDWRKRKSLGWKWRFVQDHSGNVAESYTYTYFRQGTDNNGGQTDLRMAGRPFTTQLFGRKNFGSAHSLWSAKNTDYVLGGKTDFPGQEKAVLVDKSTNMSFNAGAPSKTLCTSYWYDAYGRRIQSVLSKGYCGAADGAKIVRTAYAACKPAGSLLGFSIHTRSTYDSANTWLEGKHKLYSGNACNPTAEYVLRDKPSLKWIQTKSNIMYDIYGNVKSYQDNRGATTTIGYVTSGAFAHILPESRTVTGAGVADRTSKTLYDGHGRLVEKRGINYVSTGGLADTYSYDGLHRLRWEVRKNPGVPDQTRVRYIYDATGRKVTKLTLRPVGGTYNESITETDGLGRVIKTTADTDDGMNNTIKKLYSCTQYNSKGQAFRKSIPSFTNCSGGGSTASCTDTGGNRTATCYDPLGRVKSVRYSDGRPSKDYEYAALKQTVTIGGTRTAETNFDAFGRVTSRTGPEGTVISYGYDILDRMIRVNNGGKDITIAYDSMGRKLSIFDRNVTNTTTTTYTYLDHGSGFATDLLWTVDARGKYIRLEHDVLGRIVKRCWGTTCTDTNAETISYDNAKILGTDTILLGKMKNRKLPQRGVEVKHKIVYDYDNRGRVSRSRVVAIDDLLNPSLYHGTYYTKFTYNTYTDQLECKSLPDGSAVRIEPSATGAHVKRISYRAYTAVGVCASPGSYPEHSIEYYYYNAKGKPGQVRYYSFSTLVNRSDYGYWNWGGISAVQTYKGFTSEKVEYLTYGYNNFLELTKVSDHLRKVYDNTPTDRTRVYAYDKQGRLRGAAAGVNASCSGTTCSSGSSDSRFWAHIYEYDQKGNLTEKQGKTLAYDPAVPQRMVAYDNITYFYDAAGNVSVRAIAGGLDLGYVYNNAGMMTQASGSTGIVERNTFMGEKRVVKDYMPNDPSKRLRTYYVSPDFEVRVKQSDLSRKHSVYINGPGGRLASITRDASGTANLNYAMAVSSYTHYAIAAGIGWGTWNGIGKKMHHLRMGFIQSGTPRRIFSWCMLTTAMLLIGVGLIGLGLGARRMLRAARNRRVVFEVPLKKSKRRPLFVRLVRAALSGALLMTLGMGGCLVGLDPSGSGELLAAVRMGSDGHTISAMRDKLTGDTTGGPLPGSYFLLNNHVGSNSVIVHANTQAGAFAGNHATTVNYFPYGEIDHALSPGQDLVTFKFTGQEFDAETGLHNFGARMYDAVTGRFLSADTVVPGSGKDSQGLNRYMYVRGNPISNTDPTGHETVTENCNGPWCDTDYIGTGKFNMMPDSNSSSGLSGPGLTGWLQEASQSNVTSSHQYTSSDGGIYTLHQTTTVAEKYLGGGEFETIVARMGLRNRVIQQGGNGHTFDYLYGRSGIAYNLAVRNGVNTFNPIVYQPRLSGGIFNGKSSIIPVLPFLRHIAFDVTNMKGSMQSFQGLLSRSGFADGEGGFNSSGATYNDLSKNLAQKWNWGRVELGSDPVNAGGNILWRTAWTENALDYRFTADKRIYVPSYLGFYGEVLGTGTHHRDRVAVFSNGRTSRWLPILNVSPILDHEVGEAIFNWP